MDLPRYASTEAIASCNCERKRLPSLSQYRCTILFGAAPFRASFANRGLPNRCLKMNNLQFPYRRTHFGGTGTSGFELS